MASADHPNSGEHEPPAFASDASQPPAPFKPQEVDVLAFVAAGRRLAVELHTVEEVFSLGHLTEVPLAPDCVRGTTNLRGQLVVLVDLGSLLENQPKDRVLPGDSAVLIKRGHLRAGLLLERVIDVLSVPLARYEQEEDGGLVAGQFKGMGGRLEILNVEAALEEVQRRSAVNASRLMAEENP